MATEWYWFVQNIPTWGLCRSQMDYDETSARNLLAELDEDKSGCIDFQEFCIFIARIK